MRFVTLVGAAMVSIAALASPGIAAKQTRPVQVTEAQIASVANATLAAIGEVPTGGKVEDYEASILFAIDKLQQPLDAVDKGLLAAYEKTPDGPARTAIDNIRRMKLRLAGTRSIPSGGSFSTFGPGLGGGGGGTGNYGN